MIRVMLDTAELDHLTGVVPLLATYSDLVTDPAALRARFPDSQVILIDRGIGDPSGEASVMDVETGAYAATQARDWLVRKQSQGVSYRTIYHDRANASAVDAGAQGHEFYRWYSTLDGTAHIDGHEALHEPAAIQTTGADALGYPADLSLVFDEAWHPASLTTQLMSIRVYARELQALLPELRSAIEGITARASAGG